MPIRSRDTLGAHLPLLVLFILAALFIGWVLSGPARLARRRARICRQPFPAAWRTILRRRVPLAAKLPPPLQLQLKRHIQIFLAEKRFIGCAGQPIDDEVRVTIAAQACLLQLNRAADHYPRLRQVLVYPGAFVVDRVHSEPSGILREERQVLSGESWSQGQVILSWQDVLEGAAIADDGRNVVIHEFAHQLDQDKGSANGAPHQAGRLRRERWAAVLSAEYARLQASVAEGRAGLLSDYAATNPAEFFAVASEVFFEQGRELAEECPEVYRELSEFYRLDPRSW
ncbi:zinc-dependent peptidase [Aquabacterium sp. A7-Y]|uniref:M90 family metallopeptidase n=1 Tax=Aquabacterium sp. A7-Y TaxID=1349605 RepID=UPI00223DE58C|nr:M90 family metallopeptidase [Aquabacterium sp. A7-Y]MCW7537662.1 zinc-dependent peptidase [Aquabacterium sp. A7-Y]